MRRRAFRRTGLRAAALGIGCERAGEALSEQAEKGKDKTPPRGGSIWEVRL